MPKFSIFHKNLKNFKLEDKSNTHETDEIEMSSRYSQKTTDLKF